ncbi:ankyrin repeat domain-containing protein [bacterium]|nr:MAG: ankyrin repeat domain-containing protein [bacterium]
MSDAPAYDPDLSRRLAEEMFGASKAKPPTPLMRACIDLDVDKALPLIAKSRNPGKPDEFARTPLHEAVRYAEKGLEASIGIVTALLDRGVDIDAEDDDGQTPLHEAAVYGHEELVELLLSRGADPNARDEEGSTMLKVIDDTPEFKNRRVRIVKLLEAAGGTR